MNSQAMTNVLLLLLIVTVGFFCWQVMQFQQVMTNTETIDVITRRVVRTVEKY